MKNSKKIEKGSRRLMFCGFLAIFAMITLYAFTNNVRDTYSASESCLASLDYAQPGAYCGYVVGNDSELPACTEVLVDTCDSTGLCACYTAGSDGTQVYKIYRANLSQENPCVGGDNGDNGDNNNQNVTDNNPETGTTASYVLFILAILAGGYSLYYFKRTSSVN